MNNTSFTSKQIADFFNANYKTKFRDLDFAKPTSDSVRRVFNVLLNETIQLKPGEMLKDLGDIKFSLSKGLYIKELQHVMMILGFPDFDPVNDIAFVEKQRFLQMCTQIIKFLQVQMRYNDSRKTMLASLHNTKTILIDTISCYEKSVKRKSELQTMKEENKDKVEELQNELKAHKEEVIIYQTKTKEITTQIIEALEKIENTTKSISETTNQLNNAQQYNEWASDVVNNLKELTEMENDIATRKKRIEEHSINIKSLEGKEEQLTLIRQHVIVFKENVHMWVEAIKSLDSVIDSLGTSKKEREQAEIGLTVATEQLQKTLERGEEQQNEYEKATEKYKEVMEECNKCINQHYDEMKEAQIVVSEIEKSVENGKGEEQNLIAIIEDVENRIRNVKHVHFLILKKLRYGLEELHGHINSLYFLTEMNN